MTIEVVTVRGTEFAIYPTKAGTPAVFEFDGKESEGDALVRETGRDDTEPVRAGELLAEFPVGACVMLAEPVETAAADPLAEVISVAGREYAVSRFADGVPVVYACRSDGRYGTVLAKFWDREGRSFDTGLLKHALCPGVAMIVCASTA